ncbi:hypothetical protein [Salinicola avicenniae]|uniref:hypothetical protein n=1 Tax=Salinicola avicenniae TaxID=2916836 RepID=UPI0020739804|nr:MULTISPECIES: hypothetical protein [unclassified Salinicola]
MKTRILAAVAIAIALPAAAQANSAVNERLFEQQSEALNIQQTAQYHALPSRNAIEPVVGGHSTAADESFQHVSESTQLATDLRPSDNNLIGDGQSAAASQALQNASQTRVQDQGSVEVSFTSL